MKKKWLIMSALVLSLGLTACGDSNNDENVDDTPPATEENQDNEEADVDVDTEDDVEDTEEENSNKEEGSSNYDEVELTIEDAYAKFSEEKPDVDLENLELNYDEEDGYTYTLEGNDGLTYHEMKIDANTGDITDVNEKDKDRDAEKVVNAEYVDKLNALVDKSIDETADTFKSVEWHVEIDDDVPTLTVEVDTEDGQVDYVYNLDTEELVEEEK